MRGKFYNEETGKWISGGAAQLHLIKKSGGWENFIGGIVTEAANATAKATVAEFYKEMDSRNTQPVKNKLRRIK